MLGNTLPTQPGWWIWLQSKRFGAFGSSGEFEVLLIYGAGRNLVADRRTINPYTEEMQRAKNAPYAGAIEELASNNTHQNWKDFSSVFWNSMAMNIFNNMLIFAI